MVLGLLFNAWGGRAADLSHLRVPGVLQMIGVAVSIQMTVRSSGGNRGGVDLTQRRRLCRLGLARNNMAIIY